MGKNKNALIEDRVIRNPMEQMRRKQKMKEKDKRRELKEFIREQQMSKPQIDPLKQHDFSYINQLKNDQLRKNLGVDPERQAETNQIYAGKSGVMAGLMPRQEAESGNDILYYQVNDNQKIENYMNDNNNNEEELDNEANNGGPTWKDIQDNYFRQLQGLDVQYSQEQEIQQQQQRSNQPYYKPQPYQMKYGQGGSDEIAGNAIIYKQNGQIQSQAQKQEAKPVAQDQIQPKQQPPPKSQQPKKKIEFEDPLDPIYGEVNYREKMQQEQKKKQQNEENVLLKKQPVKKFENVSSDIKKALGLDKIQPSVQQQAPQQQVEVENLEDKEEEQENANNQIQPQPTSTGVIRRQFVPSALRKQQQTTGQSSYKPQNDPANKPQFNLIESKPFQKSQPIQSTAQPTSQQQIKTKPVVAAQPVLNSLIANYSDSEDESPRGDFPNKKQETEFKLPGQDLMFASLISEDKPPIQAPPQKSEDVLSEELKKFMAELNGQ